MRDTIYRDEAIKAIEELREEPYWLHDGSDYRVCGLSEAKDAIERLPSADRPQGEWEIYAISPFDGEDCRCSNCGKTGCAPYWNFCPNCGSRNVMKGADNDSDSI